GLRVVPGGEPRLFFRALRLRLVAAEEEVATRGRDAERVGFPRERLGRIGPVGFHGGDYRREPVSRHIRGTPGARGDTPPGREVFCSQRRRSWSPACSTSGMRRLRQRGYMLGEVVAISAIVGTMASMA